MSLGKELYGGDVGIRTLGTRFAHTHDFQSCSFNQLGHISALVFTMFLRLAFLSNIISGGNGENL